MNILLLCDEYPPCNHGGIGTVTQTLARSFVEKGHKVIVAGFYPYYRKAPVYENDEGVEVFRFFYGNKWLLKLSKHRLTGHFINIKKKFRQFIQSINQLIKQFGIDIIEVPDFTEAIYYGRFTQIDFSGLSKPYIVKLHGTYSYLYKTLHNKESEIDIQKHEKKIFDSALGVIAISKYIANVTKQIFDIHTPIINIPNGINLNHKLDYTGQKSNRVIFAGTLVETKGIFSLLKAWSQVHEEMPQLELYLYGKGEEKFTQTIKNWNTPNVFIHSQIPNQQLLQLFAQSCCAVFPSYSESLGMTPIEAMSVGCPTIYTQRCTGPEIITHYSDGLLVEPDNIKQIATSILFLAQQRTKAEKMGKNGKESVTRKFDIKIVTEQHLQFYNKILSTR